MLYQIIAILFCFASFFLSFLSIKRNYSSLHRGCSIIGGSFALQQVLRAGSRSRLAALLAFIIASQNVGVRFVVIGEVHEVIRFQIGWLLRRTAALSLRHAVSGTLLHGIFLEAATMAAILPPVERRYARTLGK